MEIVIIVLIVCGYSLISYQCFKNLYNYKKCYKSNLSLNGFNIQLLKRIDEAYKLGLSGNRYNISKFKPSAGLRIFSPLFGEGIIKITEGESLTAIFKDCTKEKFYIRSNKEYCHKLFLKEGIRSTLFANTDEDKNINPKQSTNKPISKTKPQKQ